MSDKFLKPPPLYLHLNMCFFFFSPHPPQPYTSAWCHIHCWRYSTNSCWGLVIPQSNLTDGLPMLLTHASNVWREKSPCVTVYVESVVQMMSCVCVCGLRTVFSFYPSAIKGWCGIAVGGWVGNMDTQVCECDNLKMKRHRTFYTLIPWAFLLQVLDKSASQWTWG